MLYAVALAGVPGRIVGSVVQALQERFADSHVFRGAGAPLRDNGQTLYNDAVVDEALRMAADAVFGKSRRPHGFCRNTGRPCAIKNAGKNDCGRSAEQTCSLQKPDFLIVLYQEGANEEKLLNTLHHSAYCVRLPKSCYNRRDRTIEAAVGALKEAGPVLGRIRRDIGSSKSPLLLPPNNFADASLNALLRDALKDGAKAQAEQFKRAYYGKKEQAYISRKALGFEPAALAGRHGIADVHSRSDLAVSRSLRLGCQYVRDFHYDVSRLDRRDFGGRTIFSCREKGTLRPHGGHANVSVDDCVL